MQELHASLEGTQQYTVVHIRMVHKNRMYRMYRMVHKNVWHLARGAPTTCAHRAAPRQVGQGRRVLPQAAGPPQSIKTSLTCGVEEPGQPPLGTRVLPRASDLILSTTSGFWPFPTHHYPFEAYPPQKKTMRGLPTADPLLPWLWGGAIKSQVPVFTLQPGSSGSAHAGCTPLVPQTVGPLSGMP